MPITVPTGSSARVVPTTRVAASSFENIARGGCCAYGTAALRAAPSMSGAAEIKAMAGPTCHIGQKEVDLSRLVRHATIGAV